jgi:hypothetical protein
VIAIAAEQGVIEIENRQSQTVSLQKISSKKFAKKKHRIPAGAGLFTSRHLWNNTVEFFYVLFARSLYVAK